MDWDRDAHDLLSELPLPPMMLSLARFDAEKRARAEGLARVSAAVVRRTERGYRDVLGPEAAEAAARLNRGEDIGLPAEFFMDTSDELYAIQVCPAKYGACTSEKRAMMLDAYRAVQQVLLSRDINRIMLEKARHPVMSHHAFRAAIVGCPNCCLSPHLADFSVVCVYRPEIAPETCSGCGMCAAHCSEQAIGLDNACAVIDYERCVMCGGCETVCPAGAVVTGQKGYRVLAGGRGGRRPRIAEAVVELTDSIGAERILDRALTMYEETEAGEDELSFADFVERAGIAALR